MERLTSGYEWCHAPEARARRIWGILKKSELSWVESCLGRRRLALACSPKPGQWPLWWVPDVLGGRWKSQNRKNVYLSPYVEEPLNSKVIKSFVPELRSRKCFSCFEIPMFYVYTSWTFYVRFTHIHIHVWLWYNCNFFFWTSFVYTIFIHKLQWMNEWSIKSGLSTKYLLYDFLNSKTGFYHQIIITPNPIILYDIP